MLTEGILSDTEILKAIDKGDITIDPFETKQLNITSYDLTLGDEVKLYKRWVSTPRVLTPTRQTELMSERFFSPFQGEILDSKEEPETISLKMDQAKGFVLNPGIGYLMHTRETIWTKRFNPILDGKSSIGRLFIQVHATAGFGDPGFFGQYTLEVIVQHPVRVYPGMRFCQIRFHTIAGELSKTYDQVGHYTAGQAQGAVASQAWRQFKT
jgi:dCTP deaminase